MRKPQREIGEQVCFHYGGYKDIIYRGVIIGTLVRNRWFYREQMYLVRYTTSNPIDPEQRKYFTHYEQWVNERNINRNTPAENVWKDIDGTR